jgi:hypothetical protein
MMTMMMMTTTTTMMMMTSITAVCNAPVVYNFHFMTNFRNSDIYMYIC